MGLRSLHVGTNPSDVFVTKNYFLVIVLLVPVAPELLRKVVPIVVSVGRSNMPLVSYILSNSRAFLSSNLLLIFTTRRRSSISSQSSTGMSMNSFCGLISFLSASVKGRFFFFARGWLTSTSSNSAAWELSAWFDYALVWRRDFPCAVINSLASKFVPTSFGFIDGRSTTITS